MYSAPQCSVMPQLRWRDWYVVVVSYSKMSKLMLCCRGGVSVWGDWCRVVGVEGHLFQALGNEQTTCAWR